MEQELIGYLLPEGLLEYFSITKVEELGEVSTKRMIVQIELEEKNQLPDGYNSSEYESKGFYPTKILQDFPIRGKSLYLAIKRRRWRRKDKKNEIIHTDYSLFAEGSKITQELSDFLKDTGRDPNRYHW